MEYYKLPDDLAARLATEPEQVLPVLAAKVHQAIAAGLQKTLREQIPGVVQSLNSAQQKNTEAKKAFYTRWPGLEKYETQVLQAGTLFRQMNPKATAEQAIETIGKIVSESLGIPIAPVAGAAPAAPAAPAKAAPFQPAATGSGGRGPAPASDNEFETIAEDLLVGDK